MHKRMIGQKFAAALLTALLSVAAAAKLPPPTPEQQQAAAAKKEQAAAQAEKEKQQLTEAMDRIAARWRAAGGKTHASTATTPAEGTSGPGTSGTIRSEKLGTAQPSTDVKQPEKQGPPDKIK